MAAKVYTIASGKGGTGKTTTTINLGTALALIGKKTVIIDADISMANLGLLLGLEKSPVTLHEVLSGKADVQEAVYEGPGGVYVVPCGISLQGFQNSNPEKLQEVMSTLVEDMDFMLIDAPAGISKDGVIPLAIADKVLLVVNPELSSMADAMKTKVLTEMLGGEIGGAILNRAGMERTEINKEKVADFLNVEVIEIVPEDLNIRRSAAFKIPIVIKTPNSPAAIAFKRLAAHVSGIDLIEPTEGEEESKEGFVRRLARVLFEGK
jgi:septum site-determining protein MinD